MTYEELTFETGIIVKRTNQDGSETFIPSDSANSDYQRYLRWLNGEDEDETLS